jgi:hypothetical protein
MAEALVPLLRRNCPEGAGGYGGSYQVNLDDEEAVGLGGVKLIRAAMRKAARQLGWKVTTIGMIGTRHGSRWRQTQGGEPTPCHFQLIAHRGACGKAPVAPQNHWPTPESCGNRRFTECIRFCRFMDRAVASSRWWESRPG